VAIGLEDREDLGATEAGGVEEEGMEEGGRRGTVLFSSLTSHVVSSRWMECVSIPCRM
jgi:hypothetical protein